jgi:hypothetical protein
MQAAIEVLTAELRTFEAEYMQYAHAIDEAQKYETRAHIGNLKLLRTNAWVRVATTNNLINQLMKHAEKVDA